MTQNDLPIPEAFLRRMAHLLGNDFAAFLASYDRSTYNGLRINELKSSIEHLRAQLPCPLDPVPWCPSGFLIDPQERAGRHPLHAAGLYYLQEPSAMAVAEAIDIRPGHLVVDVSASPGGKATHIASKLHGQGVLIANDPVGGRIKALGENLERWGARNAVITNAPVAELANTLPGVFDRVLVDAPCSGEGMFRKSAIARQEWSEEHVQGCAVRQDLLLNDAARMVKPGGLLVYSTCTFAPEENEQQICRFLDRHPDWELIDIPTTEGLSAGRSDWAGEHCAADVSHMARIWPHLAPGEGHSMALLHAPHTRDADPGGRNPRRSSSVGHVAPSSEMRALWQRFRAENVPAFDDAGELVQRGDQLFLVPEGLPRLPGVRVVRPGLSLGSARPGRFEPSHALALAVPPAAALQQHELDEADVARYLHGETVNAPGPPGWVLMTRHHFGLGWGKRSGAIIKNHYPKGLRW